MVIPICLQSRPLGCLVGRSDRWRLSHPLTPSFPVDLCQLDFMPHQRGLMLFVSRLFFSYYFFFFFDIIVVCLHWAFRPMCCFFAAP